MKLTDICRCMMEEGYYPRYEKTHLVFYIDGDMAVLKYEKNILSVRIFFSIDEDDYSMFLEACNTIMMNIQTIKALMTDDRKNIVFCCETLCDNRKSLRKFLPAMISNMTNAMKLHREEVRKQILAYTLYTTASTYVQ